MPVETGRRCDKDKKEVIDLLRLQMAIEGEVIRLYEESVRDIKSSPVMHLLHTMRLDSRKHIEMCQATIEVLEGQPLFDVEKNELREGLNRHIELEKKAIETASRILENAWILETPGLRELMEKLRNDEIEHHQSLNTLAEKRFHRE